MSDTKFKIVYQTNKNSYEDRYQHEEQVLSHGLINKVGLKEYHELPLDIQLYKKLGNEYIPQGIYDKQFKNNLGSSGYGSIEYHGGFDIDNYYVEIAQLKQLMKVEENRNPTESSENYNSDQYGGSRNRRSIRKRLSRKQKRSRNKPKKSRKARSKPRH
jgi:hypothetical protein